MTSALKPLIAGNWKMNGLIASKSELAAMISGSVAAAGNYELLICPPATLIASFAQAAHGSAVAIGAQDCHPKPSGAHTGDISAPMLHDAGASFVIVGHSERRVDHHETDAAVRAKAEAAMGAGLTAIVCVGESQAERDAGKALDVIGRQLEGSLPKQATAKTLVVAYEPIWAIGTGRVPTDAEVEQVHTFVRDQLRKHMSGDADAVRILYGGSVKPSNAAQLLAIADVNGALVGGASLKASDFLGIAAACGR